MTDNKLEIILAAKDITGDTFARVQSSISNMGKSIVSINGMIAGFAGAAGLGMIAKQSMDAVAEIDRLSTMAGVGSEAFQELTYAAGQYQITQDALTDGLKELSLRGDEFVVTGAGPAKEAFERLGYSAKELNGMLNDTPGLLSDVISRMEGLDKASQIRIADELFGGMGGEQFVSMIQGGSKALDVMRKSARDLGVVIDQDMVKQSVEAKRQVENLTTVLSSNFTAVMAELSPYIVEASTKTIEWIGANKGLIEQGVDIFVREIGDAFDFTSRAVDKTSEAVETLIGWYGKLPKGLLSMEYQYADGKDINELIYDINNGTFFQAGSVTIPIVGEYTPFGKTSKENKSDNKNETQKRSLSQIGNVGQKKKTKSENVLSEFSDAYSKSTMSEFDYQVNLLDKQYANYDKYVNDKNALDEWYSSEYFALYDEQTAKEVDELKRASEEYEKVQSEFSDAYSKSTMSEFDYQVNLLDKQYANYDKYVTDKKSLDEWYSSEYFALYDEQTAKEVDAQAKSAEEYKKVQKEKILASNDFFAGLKLNMEESQKNFTTWAKEGVKISEDAAGGMRMAFSDTLFSALKGDLEDITSVWKSFMDDMLLSLTDTVADMAVQWGIGTVGSATGWWESGAWEVKKDHVAMVHKGEMIVPADVASILRNGAGSGDVSALARVSPSGGHEWSDADKDMLTRMIDAPTDADIKSFNQLSSLQKKANESFAFGTLDSFAKSAAQGMSLLSTDKISVGDFMTGLFGPGLGYAAVTGGVTGYARTQMGLDTSNFGDYGSLAGSVLGSLFGGPVGAIAGNLVGGLLGMIAGDAMDARENEDLRDAYEDGFGFVPGLRAYAAFAAAMEDSGYKTPAAWETDLSLDGYVSDWGGLSMSAHDGWGNEKGKGGRTDGYGGWGNSNNNGGRTDGYGGWSGSSGGSGGKTTGNSSHGNDNSTGGMSSGVGWSKGGVVDRLMVPGEDGVAALKFGEGVIDKDTMSILSDAIRQAAAGSTSGSNRPINITVQIGDAEFRSYIGKVADDIRVQANRRGLTTDRIY